MIEVAPGVHQLHSTPADAINCYLVGDVLIDSGAFWQQKGVIGQLSGHRLSAHAITHGHFDHYGAARALARQRQIPVWAGAADVDAIERGKMVAELPLLGRRDLPAARGVAIDRALREGDDVAGFTVIDTPGHSPGHVSFWRESDGVLICGDVIWGRNAFTFQKGVREPFRVLSPDADANRESARRLAALRPQTVCFGHGPVLRDPDAFAAAVARLR